MRIAESADLVFATGAFDSALMTAIVGAVFALVGTAVGARIGASGARSAALTQARAGYTTALEQQNHEARRSAYIDLYAAGMALMQDLAPFARLDSRTVASEDPVDPFAVHRDRVSRAAAAIRILGPAHVWQRTREIEERVNYETQRVHNERDLFYGWRNLTMTRRTDGAAGEAMLALLRIYNARSERNRERAHEAADGPLRSAEAAGIISEGQRGALLVDPMDVSVTYPLQPWRQLRIACAGIRESLEAFAGAAGSYLEDTNLP